MRRSTKKASSPKRRRISGVKKTHRRRRRGRIGATGEIGGMLETAGGIGLGAIAGREIAVLLGNMIPSLQANPLIVGVGQAAAGMFLSAKNKGFMQYLGYGLVANGVVTAAVATGIISGPTDRMAYQINGTSNLPVLSGTSNLPVVSGTATRIANNNPPGIGAATRISNNNVPARVYVKSYNPML